MSSVEENNGPKPELFSGLEGLERGNALLDKLKEYIPEEDVPDATWSYDEFGRISDIDYLNSSNLAMAIDNAGSAAEGILSQLYKLIKAEQEICRFPERLAEPDQESLNAIKIELEKFSTEEINRVAAISEVSELSKDMNRPLMNAAVSHFGKILENLRTQTKVFLDSEQTLYPEFWELYNKVDAMRVAVGGIVKDEIIRTSKIKNKI